MSDEDSKLNSDKSESSLQRMARSIEYKLAIAAEQDLISPDYLNSNPDFRIQSASRQDPSGHWHFYRHRFEPLN